MTMKRKAIQKRVTGDGKSELLGKRGARNNSKRMADLFSLDAIVQKRLKTTKKSSKALAVKALGDDPGVSGAKPVSLTTRSELRYFAGFKLRKKVSFAEVSSIGKIEYLGVVSILKFYFSSKI